jgi:hypothetical protein
MKRTFNKEADVKQAVKEIFKKYDVYFFMPSMNGFGRAGIPDFTACYKGHYIAIETKFGKNTLTAHQWKEINDINSHGGITMIVSEANLGDLDALFSAINALDS